MSENEPTPKAKNERRQIIIMLVLIAVIVVGTGIHYYIYAQRQAERGRQIGPDADRPRTIFEAVGGAGAPVTQPAADAVIQPPESGSHADAPTPQP